MVARIGGATAIWRGVAGLAVLAIAIEVIARAELTPSGAIPPASSILLTFAGLLGDPEFLGHVGGTVLAWTGGMALAIGVGSSLGLALGLSPRAERAATAAIEVLRPIPSVALLPLAILLLGRGLDMKVALAAYAATWPILVNTLAGVRSVDPVAVDTARVFGLGRPAVLRWVVIPSAAPLAFGGIRISAAVALIVVISAELLAGGGSGLGTWMLGVSQAGVAREQLWAGILASGLLGLALNGLLTSGERRLLGWRDGLTRST